MADHRQHASHSQEQINPPHGIPLKIYQQSEVRITSKDMGFPQTNTIPDGVSGTISEDSGDEVQDFKKSSGESDLGIVTRAYHGI
jgi:hypothetical protein